MVPAPKKNVDICKSLCYSVIYFAGFMPRRGLTTSYFTVAGIGVTCPAMREAWPFSLEVVSERPAASGAPNL